MRPIDADALTIIVARAEEEARYKAFQHSSVGPLPDFDTWKMNFTTAAVLGNCKGYIANAPTADAIPVSYLESLRDNARSAEAAETINEILRLWDEEAKG